MHVRQRTKHKKAWLLGIALVAVVTTTGLAVQQSVTVDVRWKVFPYQTLRVLGNRVETAAATYTLPDPSPLDVTRGYIEDPNAVRLQIVSNTSWKIQIRATRIPGASGTVLVRRYGGIYGTLSESPQILASGAHGTFDVSVCFRVPLEDLVGTDRDDRIDVVYTIMSD